METTNQTETTTQNKKVYPFEDEDKSYEKDIVDAVKALQGEQKIQFIALNNLLLEKKQQDTDLDVEMKTLVNKYNKLQEPLTQASDAIIRGTRGLTEEELKEVRKHLTDEEAGKLAEVTAEPIADYWYTAILNCPPIAGYIEEADKAILKHLVRIDHKPDEENDNFTLIFEFSENEYFENKTLSVKFYLLNENEAEKTEGTEITWKEGKNITKKTITKKQKNKKTGKTREVKKEVDADSFFNLFSTINVDDAEEAEEEEGNELLEKLDRNLEIAQNIENELLPYHLEYFLGIREPEDDDDGGDFDDDDMDDDDEDDDGDDDDHPKPKKKKKDSEDAPGAPGAGEQKQECKQQ